MFIQLAGDVLCAAVPAVPGFYSLHQKKYRQFAYIAAAIAISQLAIALIKTVTRVQRPDKGNFRSFPSGHTQAAFLGATFFLIQHGWKKSIPLFIAAIFVAFSRVYTRRHWPTDVLAGAVLGIIVAKGVSMLPGFSDRRI